MKQFLLFLFALVSIVSCAQTKGTAKLYGFKEPVLPGVNPNIIQEDGNTVQEEKEQGMNYFIYLQSAARVYPSELWIMGTPYSVAVHTVKTPVERQQFTVPGKGKFVLVPATADKVVQLSPAPAIETKLSNKGKSLAAENALVVVYKQGGKFYYSSLKELQQLTPVALQ